MVVPDRVCDVWIASVQVFAPYQRVLGALLTDGERTHVNGYRRPHDRAVACLSRVLLRLLLAQYLRLEPYSVPVDRRCPACGEPHGKPRLRGVTALEFSVTHSADLVMFAFNGKAPVGVDVESLVNEPPVPSMELVEMALTPAERQQVYQAPASDRWEVFLSYWTCKEALLKRLGAGVWIRFHDIIVDPFGRGQKANVKVDGWDLGEARVTALDLGGSYIGAVATACEVRELRIAHVPVTLLSGA